MVCLGMPGSSGAPSQFFSPLAGSEPQGEKLTCWGVGYEAVRTKRYPLSRENSQFFQGLGGGSLKELLLKTQVGHFSKKGFLCL